MSVVAEEIPNSRLRDLARQGGTGLRLSAIAQNEREKAQQARKERKQQEIKRRKKRAKEQKMIQRIRQRARQDGLLT